MILSNSTFRHPRPVWFDLWGPGHRSVASSLLRSHEQVAALASNCQIGFKTAGLEPTLGFLGLSGGNMQADQWHKIGFKTTENSGARANLGHHSAVGWQHAADQWHKVGFKQQARANLGHLSAVGWQHAADQSHKVGFKTAGLEPT